MNVRKGDPQNIDTVKGSDGRGPWAYSGDWFWQRGFVRPESTK